MHSFDKMRKKHKDILYIVRVAGIRWHDLDMYENMLHPALHPIIWETTVIVYSCETNSKERSMLYGFTNGINTS